MLSQIETPNWTLLKLLIIISAVLLSACADIGYYWHSTKGHLSIMDKRVDISTLLEDPDLDTELRSRLVLIQTIRIFSIEALALPDNDSYTSYAQLNRPYVLKNLFAAPEFSTRLLSWCYPIAGCASYRGYYDEDLLAEFAATLKKGNADIHIGKVPAYSTLGWFDDPVLSSFVHWPETRLAGLIFHELTHQRLYVDNDTLFNESLASAVQRAGTEQWLKSRRKSNEIAQFRTSNLYSRAVVELIEQTRAELDTLYETEISPETKRKQKQTILDTAIERHATLAASYNKKGGYTHWFSSGLNNAKLASISAYNVHVPAFINMMDAQQGDFEKFFDYVETIAELPKSKRDGCLDAWHKKNNLIEKSCAS
ncbi:MAG: putative aminopeptidase [Gammaproteobacteria bacterium]